MSRNTENSLREVLKSGLERFLVHADDKVCEACEEDKVSRPLFIKKPPSFIPKWACCELIFHEMKPIPVKTFLSFPHAGAQYLCLGRKIQKCLCCKELHL